MGLVIKNNELNRGAVIVRISESTGLYIYGRFKDKEFIYEYYFPFVIGRTRCDNDEITIERHLDKESYAVVCDEFKDRCYPYNLSAKCNGLSGLHFVIGKRS